ncbi:hypothetical protein [Dyella sp. ASV21]|uniref:HdeD family acid-resistance protein n=1 Tax=Dyella sp. ASV21 TaxID=2795114 RepID=UPI0018ECB568|nr:hypothetical protein [Dyella sp. ASV21]
MIRLVLILLGADFIRTRWPWLAITGLLWSLMGAAIFVDALDGVSYFPIHVFGYLLLIEAVVTLVVSSPRPGASTVLRKARGAAFLVLGLLIVDRHHAAEVVLAMAFGLGFLVDGGFRVASALVVRFPGWRLSLLTGVFEVLFAGFMFEPYPTFYAGTVPYCIGMGLFLSGLGLFRQAVRLKRLPTDTALSVLLTQALPGTQALALDPRDATIAGDLVVHVWTPAGSVADVVPQPLVDRYIAAIDAKGVVSTGHAALVCPPDIYASHYPAIEIDRSGGDFIHMLRATAENNVEGRFQPSYAEEAAGWCDSTAQVRFAEYDRARLVAFWRRYREDTTYNLTHRNCSSTVAHCLEVALEGYVVRDSGGWRAFVRTVFNPELWFAAQLRKRAEAMAWTPGLVLDYARALHAAIHPAPWGWASLVDGVVRAWRYGKLVWRKQPIPGIEAAAATLDALRRESKHGP